MELLKNGDKVGIVACSNGLTADTKGVAEKLIDALEELGLEAVMSKKLYRENLIYNGTNKEKAEVLNDFFKADSIKAIFDISGGDAANGILEYLDYDAIKNNTKLLFGYSDLTVLLNSIYAKTNMPSYLYQIKNIIGNYSEIQKKNFKNTFINGENAELLNFNYKWVQGNHMKGTIIGGNIRCFLKLAGTEYLPDFNNKILLLESLSGDAFKMNTFINQYKQMGVFKKIKGIILGSFTEMEQKNIKPDVISIIKDIINDENIPIIKTDMIGHGQNSRCISIGSEMNFVR